MSTELGEKAIIGLIEPVMLQGKKQNAIFKAKVDTGATKSSIDESLVPVLGLGPIIGETTVKNANGTEKRGFVDITVEIAGHTVTEHFTIANRTHMRFPILIGKNILRKGGFLIDPNRKTRMFRK
ncbi:ATP-dependent zinc protease [Candidatus Woesearchaeota archaeon]|nr:ATP-dependent zinc protease [Candidatus Woesearchaeota archaeon]